MKSVAPLNDLFNMAGMNLPSFLKGEDKNGAKLAKENKPTDTEAEVVI